MIQMGSRKRGNERRSSIFHGNDWAEKTRERVGIGESQTKNGARGTMTPHPAAAPGEIGPNHMRSSHEDEKEKGRRIIEPRGTLKGRMQHAKREDLENGMKGLRVIERRKLHLSGGKQLLQRAGAWITGKSPEG
uniref:Uncharacterized protein n=1 Tax=Pristionchus pacificus TaxID=54126 RepID=A0A2A6CXR4_PRIPA|eukprot:PDM82857.1 hypothetical protein PRIPAC_37250 [Pristionchus pacificus]